MLLLLLWLLRLSRSDSYAVACAMHSYPIAHTRIHSPTRTHSTRFGAVCLFVSYTQRNVSVASFLLTLSFVRAHPSVKLGTFTRLDMKKSTLQIYANTNSDLFNINYLSWTGQANNRWTNTKPNTQISTNCRFFSKKSAFSRSHHSEINQVNFLVLMKFQDIFCDINHFNLFII